MAVKNRSKAFMGAVENTLCGRLWETSIARETPDCLVMIRRENAHHISMRSVGFPTFEIATESAASWRRFARSNHDLTKARVSSFALAGYASRMAIDLDLAVASVSALSAALRSRSAFTSVDQARAIRRLRGSVSKPIASWPAILDATTAVPDPTIGSRTRRRLVDRRSRCQIIDGAIRAGNG